MMAIPAIDLRDGTCVQLIGGSYDAERVRLPDPVSVAQRWASAGFRRLHVVDLDAALGCGSNSAVVAGIVRQAGVPVQGGGGMRTQEAIAHLVAAGADRVVIGTRGIEEPAWLASMCGHFPDRLVLAADVRGRHVVTNGWRNTRPLDVVDVVATCRSLPLAGLLVTAVHVEGQMTGPDLGLVEAVVQAARELPVIAAGGVGSMKDLHALAKCGASATVIGMALYTGTLNPRAVAEEYPE